MRLDDVASVAMGRCFSVTVTNWPGLCGRGHLSQTSRRTHSLTPDDAVTCLDVVTGPVSWLPCPSQYSPLRTVVPSCIVLPSYHLCIPRCHRLQRLWDDSTKISESDREAIKGRLVDLMCAVPDATQRQLSDALTIISKTDFPDRWPTLLPALVSKLGGPGMDLRVTNGVLEAANSVFKRYGVFGGMAWLSAATELYMRALVWRRRPGSADPVSDRKG